MASIGRAANDVSVDAASDELVAGPALRDDTRSRAMGSARWSAVRQWRFVSLVAASPAVLTSKGEFGEHAEGLCPDRGWFIIIINNGARLCVTYGFPEIL